MCTLRMAVLLCALWLPAMAVSLPMSPADRAQAFAACAGIYAADAAHAGLPGAAAADQAATRRAHFLDLLDASVQPGAMVPARAVLVQARLAQRHLLETAAFSPRARARTHAAAAAARSRARCDALSPGA